MYGNYVQTHECMEKASNHVAAVPSLEAANTFAHTHVQFHQDLIHLLLFHETQQAI